MLLNLEGLWSDWMALAALGTVAVTGLLLACCSLCGVCTCGDRRRERRAEAVTRKESSPERIERQPVSAAALRRAA